MTDALVIPLILLVEEVQEGGGGDVEEVGLGLIVDPSGPTAADSEISAALKIIGGALLEAGNIPSLVELTLVVLRLDGLVLKTALLCGTSPSVEGGTGLGGGLSEAAADEGAVEHF